MTRLDAVLGKSKMEELVAARSTERKQQDDKLKVRAERKPSDDANVWPPLWPALTEDWPPRGGAELVRIYEVSPPIFLLSDGRRVDGEYMVDAIRAARTKEHITDAIKMEALHQILLYGNPRNGPSLAENVAFLIGLNCPLNGNSVYDPPLTMMLGDAQPQQLKIIRMLIAAGADCEAARNIANQKFENLWDMILEADV